MRIDREPQTSSVNDDVSPESTASTHEVAHAGAISPEQILLTATEVVRDSREDARNRLQCARSFSHSRVYKTVMGRLGIGHLYIDNAGEPEQVISVVRRITMEVITAATMNEDDEAFDAGVASIDLSGLI